MKAKEYYAKYKVSLTAKSEAIAKIAARNFLNELIGDTVTTAKSRKVVRPSALAAVVKETNQKYNAVSAMFKKEFGDTPLLQDGFINYFKDTAPAWLLPYLEQPQQQPVSRPAFSF